MVTGLLLLGLMSFPMTSKTTSDTAVHRTAIRTPQVHRTFIRLAQVQPAMEVSRASKPLRFETFEVTAYSPTAAECDANPMSTASGKRVYVGGIAADLRVLPFGSIVIIPGYNNNGPCTVIDTGGAIRGHKLDVFLWSSHEAVHWGRRKNVRVQILYIPRRK